ncbi:MAG: molybdopterin molybdotransferase MoeA [Longimicrobiales bacterium]
MSGAPPDFESRTPDWLSYEDALARVLAAARTGPTERVPLDRADGRALAEDLHASATLPPWDNSAMDGYAVRADDVGGASSATPVSLRVVGSVRAGAPPAGRVEPGQAVRIMTGAPLPPGADSVVRVEDTDGEAGQDGRVVVLLDRDAGRNVRPGGEDMEVGDRVLVAGSTVHAGTVGVLAALGVTEVPVVRRPVVAILATGDELRPPERYDEVRAGAGIPESNGPMLAAAVRAAGGEPRLLPVAPDEPDALRSRLAEARASDVLVTIGGASMGEADLVKRVLDDLGFDLSFWRATIRPGSPVSFGFLPAGPGPDATPLPVFGLPGNPSSAFVTFEIFVRPFLRRAGGHGACLRRRVRCVAEERLSAPAGLTYFLRVEVRDGPAGVPLVRPAGPQGSGLVSGLGRAHGLAVVGPEAEGVEPGQEVDVILLDGGTEAEPPSHVR